MSYVQSEHIPSGIYIIRNYGTRNLIALRSRDKELLGSISTTDRSWKWLVTHNSNNKYTIQSVPDGFHAQCPPTPQSGHSIVVESIHCQWEIKQVSGVAARDCYWIYSSKNVRLVWSLPNGEDGQSVVFAVESSNPRLWWRFERFEDAASSMEEVTGRLMNLPVHDTEVAYGSGNLNNPQA
ncbi:hypothetical protein BD410DRAFT_866889 [Rickenella mellea]|uniref:Ricin B lectin domain-containing protein n=1 Tax=Rickenella mellea TaxID=50990 RepID=A0A4Y7Q2R8_9AGAM|nr:hypothetical protein BD410DRAFT_866889 [Rickenella mellea]